MDNTVTESRFFTTDDKACKNFIYDLPEEWWSRFYEYEWCKNFIEENDTVLDAASGVYHPLKYYLADNCKGVYACDRDKSIELKNYNEITDKELQEYFLERKKLEYINKEFYFNKIQNTCCSITQLPYKDNFFDKIFCISVLEHLDDRFNKIYWLYKYLLPYIDNIKHNDLYLTLKEFKRCLKPGGQIILTFDYPRISLGYLEFLAKKLDLKFVSGFNETIPPNAVYSEKYKLYCFRALLTKNN